MSDLDITAEIEFHRKHGKLGDDNQPCNHPEGMELLNWTTIWSKDSSKNLRGDGGLINGGGFFILSPKCMELF